MNPKPSTNSFALQYMSLILIILAFCVGAFLRGPKTAEATVPELPKGESIHFLTDLSFKNLFDGSELNESELGTLITLVKSHDIRAEISIFPESESEADYYMALSRAITLNDFFKLKLPREGWRVFVSGATNEKQAQAKFFSLDDVYGKLETNPTTESDLTHQNSKTQSAEIDDDVTLMIDKLVADSDLEEERDDLLEFGL